MSKEKGLVEHGMWRKCSTCKGDIGLGDRYFVCSVSTCNTSRAPLVFCSLQCWQAHVPAMRHRDAWAEERQAPGREASEPGAHPAVAVRTHAVAVPGEPVRRHVVAGATSGGPESVGQHKETPSEILIVASKLKAYIRETAEMNTSDRVFGLLSDHVRALCQKAVREAVQEGRKTVLDRDFSTVLRKLD